MSAFISVICPIYNEEQHIAKCVDSIIGQDYPKEKMEVLFVDGMSTDKTRVLLKPYLQQYSFLSLLENPQRTAPCAMNIGIKAAKGNLIIRLDGHALYPKNYFSKLVYWHSQLKNADNIGGICNTDVVNKTKTSVAIAKVMSDKFGVGNSKFRTGSNKKSLEVDTVPFGCYKRDVFDKIGLYNEQLTRCQDIEFNKRLKRNGGKIFIIPEISCTYIPREKFKTFARNRYLTGLWVIKSSKITKTFKNLGIRHFIPLCFVSSLFTSIFLGLFSSLIFLIGVFILLLYSLLMFTRAIKINDEETSSLHVFIAFLVLHLSYGFGSLVGVIKPVNK